MNYHVAILSEQGELFAIPLILQKYNFITTLTSDLNKLFKLMKKNEIHCIIFDVPESLDGHMETLERILKKKPPDWSEVVTSGSTTMEALRKAMRLGIKYFLTRPFPEDELVHSVKRSVMHYRLEKENRTLVDKLNKKVFQLKLLNETAKMLNSSLQLDDILLKLMQNAGEIVDAEAWTLFMYEPEKHVLIFKYVVGEAADKLTGMELPWGKGIVGWAASNKSSILVKDTGKDERFFKNIDKKTKFTTKSVICVPILYREDLLGVVEVINKRDGGEFNEEDLGILEILVEDAAISIKNSYLLDETYRLTLEDQLTKLYNLRKYQIITDQLIDEGRFFSLLFMDLDNFKMVNDKYGHRYGSETLEEFANVLREIKRDDDYAFRYGGDEFLLLLPDTDLDKAQEAAKNIHEYLKTYNFINKDGISVRLGASIGICDYPGNAGDANDILLNSDKAMYSVKRAGKNGFAVYNKDMKYESI